MSENFYWEKGPESWSLIKKDTGAQLGTVYTKKAGVELVLNLKKSKTEEMSTRDLNSLVKEISFTDGNLALESGIQGEIKKIDQEKNIRNILLSP